jgi:hypothetical protein
VFLVSWTVPRYYAMQNSLGRIASREFAEVDRSVTRMRINGLSWLRAKRFESGATQACARKRPVRCQKVHGMIHTTSTPPIFWIQLRLSTFIGTLLPGLSWS